jgi:hypothetical protein
LKLADKPSCLGGEELSDERLGSGLTTKACNKFSQDLLQNAQLLKTSWWFESIRYSKILTYGYYYHLLVVTSSVSPNSMALGIRVRLHG